MAFSSKLAYKNTTLPFKENFSTIYASNWVPSFTPQNGLAFSNLSLKYLILIWHFVELKNCWSKPLQIFYCTNDTMISGSLKIDLHNCNLFYLSFDNLIQRIQDSASLVYADLMWTCLLKVMPKRISIVHSIFWILDPQETVTYIADTLLSPSHCYKILAHLPTDLRFFYW